MRLVCSCCGKKTESDSFSGYGGGSCEYSSEGVHIFINDSSRYVCCYCGKESGGGMILEKDVAIARLDIINL